MSFPRTVWIEEVEYRIGPTSAPALEAAQDLLEKGKNVSELVVHLNRAEGEGGEMFPASIILAALGKE